MGFGCLIHVTHLRLYSAAQMREILREIFIPGLMLNSFKKLDPENPMGQIFHIS